MENEPTPAEVVGTVFENGADEISRSYAVALLNIIGSRDDAQLILDELDELVNDVYRDQPDFARLLSNGISDAQRRDQLLVSAFEGRAHETVLNFLRVLNRRGRLGLVPLIARTARSLWDHQNNRIPVTIRTAVPMDDEQRAMLRDRLVPLTQGAEPMLIEEVDPELLGGVVVQVGDQLFDASVRYRLRRMREALIQGQAGGIRSRMTDLFLD